MKTDPKKESGSDQLPVSARILRAELFQEDWPAVIHSLILALELGGRADRVELRYGWDGSPPLYTLRAENIQNTDTASVWECLVPVPKAAAMVEYYFIVDLNSRRYTLKPQDGREYYRNTM